MYLNIHGATARDIATSIEQALSGGLWERGQRLPPIRRLAAELRVSPVTVTAAYRLLRARGLAVGQGRRGTRVRFEPAAVATARGGEHLAQLHDLAGGNPDVDLLPPMLPVLRALEYSAPLYGTAPVFRPLETFARAELAADGVPADALFIASGTLDAIERLSREYLRAGDRLAVEDPALPGLVELSESSGFLVEPLGIDAEGPLPDSFERVLERGVRALVVTARAQNPTGAAISPARAHLLKRLLRRHRDVLLIESDPAGPVAGVPIATLCDGQHPRWAAIRSTSTFLGPDLRMAIVGGDRLTIARAQHRQALGARWVSHLLQHVAYLLWSDPSSARRLARAGEVYAHRRAALLTALADKGIRAHAVSGFNLWLAVRAETAVVQGLAAQGWAVAPGERFRVRSAPGVRVTVATLAPSDTQRFAADFEQAARASIVASA